MQYQVASIRPQDCWWAVLNSSGYAMGTTGSIANGSDAGMGQFDDVRGISIPTLTATTINMSGGSIKQVDPRSALEGTLTAGTRDLTFVSKFNGLSTASFGDATAMMLSNICPPYVNMCGIVNMPAINRTAGSQGTKGYLSYAILNMQFTDAETIEFAFGTEQVDFAFPFASSFVDTAFWGDSTLSTEWGTSQAHVLDLGFSEYPWTAHTFVHDNSTTSFTVDQTPAAASADKVVVFEAGTLQAYTTDYTVTTATKTIGGITATTAGTVIVALYQYVPTC